MTIIDCSGSVFVVDNATVYKYDTDRIALPTNRESVNIKEYIKKVDK